jgi:hypothetical protein
MFLVRMIIFRRVFFIMGMLYVYRALTFRHGLTYTSAFSVQA